MRSNRVGFRVVVSVMLVVLMASIAFGEVAAVTSVASAPSLLNDVWFLSVLGGSEIKSVGATKITGELDLSPGNVVNGFPPGLVVAGLLHINDAVAAQAQIDSAFAYNNMVGQACTQNLSGTNLGGLTLLPGVYCFDASAKLDGQLTLDAGGKPYESFVFKIANKLDVTKASSVVVQNGGNSCNVWWQVGNSVRLEKKSQFIGNVFALNDIRLDNGAKVLGRILTRNGAVTLNNSEVGGCAIPRPPSNIYITGATASTISTAWTASPTPDLTYYKVWRSRNGATLWTLVGTVTPPSVSFVDGGLASQTRYYYRAQACFVMPDGRVNCSGYTNVVNAITP